MKTKEKRGRPAGRLRTVKLQIYLTEMEAAHLDLYSETSGESRSSIVRRLIRSLPLTAERPLTTDPEDE